jgi:hypothetical protein
MNPSLSEQLAALWESRKPAERAGQGGPGQDRHQHHIALDVQDAITGAKGPRTEPRKDEDEGAVARYFRGLLNAHLD